MPPLADGNAESEVPQRITASAGAQEEPVLVDREHHACDVAGHRFDREGGVWFG